MGGLTREPHRGGGGGLVALRFVLNMISQQEPVQKRRNNLPREGSLVKRGGKHAWERSKRRPLRKRGCCGLRKRGFGLHPEGFAPGKSGGLGQRRLYLMNLATFSNILSNYRGGEKKKKKRKRNPTATAAARVRGQPGELPPSPARSGRRGPGGCTRAAAPDTRTPTAAFTRTRFCDYRHTMRVAPEPPRSCI